jgi:predicted AAA+ superfamily ATPase
LPVTYIISMMITRPISSVIFSPEFGRQMRFIAGPRQVGKTTIAREFLRQQQCKDLYYNWDERNVRDRYRVDSHFFSKDVYNVTPSSGKRWVCMDEIHKYPRWKNVLKDFFDSYGEDTGFIITGSARLDMLRKSGDSLAGRYFLFHVNPLTLAEVVGKNAISDPPEHADTFIRDRLERVHYHEKELEALLTFGGFPEPFLSSSLRFHARWRDDYIDRIVREDLRDLSHVHELENISILIKLLPERICSPLSINGLANDLKTSFMTVAGYIKLLELGYILFRVRPYAKKLARGLTKETKAYFYDWTRVDEKTHRFENYAALELKSLVDRWTDSGSGNFDLRYIRTRDGKETDFLILRDEKPWLLAEIKWSRSPVESHHLKNRELLGEKVPFIQIVHEHGITEKFQPMVYQMSASRFFS